MTNRFNWVFIVLAILLLFPVGAVLANGGTQEYTVEQEWKDTEREEPQVPVPTFFRPARFYYNYGLGYLNLARVSDLNDRTHDDFPDLSTGMLVRRWNWVLGLGNDWRAGWVKVHGSQSTSTGAGEDFRQVTYSLEAGGFLVERVVYVDGLTDLALGVAAGRGTQEVKLLFSQPGTGEIDNPWKEPISSNLSQPFYFLQPQFNARFRLTGPFTANLQGGYTFTLGRDRWTIEGEAIRDERFRPDGFHLSAGLGVRF